MDISKSAIVLYWLSKFRDEIRRRQDQDEAAADEHDPSQLHIGELDTIEEYITEGGGGDGSDQAERDEVFVCDEDTQVSQHVGS